MKVFKYISITLILFVIINRANAQLDNLIPNKDIFSIYNYQFEYYSKVRTILFEGLSEYPVIRFLEMPSGYPENVLSIECIKSKYHLVYHICDRPIWNYQKLRESNVIVYKKNISKESVNIIKALFKVALSKTSYPPETNSIVLDGANYYFSIFDNGIKTGYVWSPDKGSRMGRLVNICFQLIDLAKNSDIAIILNEKLQSEIIDLTNEITSNDR